MFILLLLHKLCTHSRELQKYSCNLIFTLQELPIISHVFTFKIKPKFKFLKRKHHTYLHRLG